MILFNLLSFSYDDSWVHVGYSSTRSNQSCSKEHTASNTFNQPSTSIFCFLYISKSKIAALVRFLLHYSPSCIGLVYEISNEILVRLRFYRKSNKNLKFFTVATKIKKTSKCICTKEKSFFIWIFSWIHPSENTQQTSTHLPVWVFKLFEGFYM